jgi:arylsulfatase A-like enzyme
MLRPHGYRNYMLGKWHVTPLTESGATGPFDGWPLGRGFDRFYGFMDAETDQYAPELVRDNTPVDPPGSFATGYHLTADLVDQAIRYLADHVADNVDIPWLTWVALGACHAPHQAPFDVIRKYDALFANGWDDERDRRIARQKETGIVPNDTRLPPRNDACGRGPSFLTASAGYAPAGGLCGDAGTRRPAPGGARSSRPARRHDDLVSSTTAPARRAGRLAWSMPWAPTT